MLMLTAGDGYCYLVMAVTLVVNAVLSQQQLPLLVLTPEHQQQSLNLQCQLTAAVPAERVSAGA
jgi:hypothetical protein